MPQPLIELGGESSAPTMTIAPANGFVPQTYLPMIARFTDDYHVVSLPPRALWGDGAPPEMTPDFTWRELADEMVSGMNTFSLTNVVGVGHSIGGIMTILAAIRDPERIKALILLDPVILPRQACDYMRAQRQQGKIMNEKMVQGALKRRNSFESVESAFENFHGKSIFANWSDEVLRLYVEHGTVENESGTRSLVWSPEWEAFYFASYYTEIWDELPKLNDLAIPILFIAGAESDTFFPHVVDEVADLIPLADVERLAGHGHLFPQSAPQQTANIIQDWLTSNT